MKKFISGMLVMLLIFTTPASNINVSAEGNNNSSSSVFTGPIVLALKIILYPLASIGGIYVVCQGINKIFALNPENDSWEIAKLGMKKVYMTTKNGFNYGINKLNGVFINSDVD